jgi:peptidoglycan hydrolase CwlO-like protein
MVKLAEDAVRDMFSTIVGRWFIVLVSSLVVMVPGAALMAFRDYNTNMVTIQSALVTMQENQKNMHMDIKDVRADLKGIQKDVQNVEKAQAALEARHSYRSIPGNP